MTLPLATIGPLDVRVALRAIGDRRLPDDLAVARIERDEPRVGRRDEDLVLVDREVAHRALPDAASRPDFVLPDQVARARVERLHDVAGVDEIHDAVVHERHASGSRRVSFIAQTHASFRSFTLARVISLSGL